MSTARVVDQAGVETDVYKRQLPASLAEELVAKARV